LASGCALSAWPPSAWYRLRKFARRHKPVVASAMVLLPTTVVGLALGLWAVNGERRQTAAERDQKDQALAAEATARKQTREALDTLTDEAVERLMARQPQLTEPDRAFLRKVLAFHEAFAAASTDGAEGRASVAAGHYRVGLIRAKLGERKDAEVAYRAALGHFGKLADESPTVPEYRSGLAKTHTSLAILLSQTGWPKEAEEAYRAALTLYRKLADESPAVPEYRSGLAKTHTSLAILLTETGWPKEAEEAYRAALTLYRKLADDRSIVVTSRAFSILFCEARFNVMPVTLPPAARTANCEYRSFRHCVPVLPVVGTQVESVGERIYSGNDERMRREPPAARISSWGERCEETIRRTS
jgi:tetratricopeptide (TPR) repeat protein